MADEIHSAHGQIKVVRQAAHTTTPQIETRLVSLTVV